VIAPGRWHWLPSGADEDAARTMGWLSAVPAADLMFWLEPDAGAPVLATPHRPAASRRRARPDGIGTGLGSAASRVQRAPAGRPGVHAML